jgi:hypothetical protein
MMTEEERQKIILELEQEITRGDKPSREREVCGSKLVKGECEDHPVYIRMHERALKDIQKQYE